MSTFVQTTLGGGKKGSQPLLFGNMDGGNERATSRKYLAKAFGNLHNSGLGSSPALYNKNILGPFRTAYNAGDVTSNGYSATNSKYGVAPNQVGGNNLSKIQNVGDGVSRNGNASYSGNPKFIHDGSDYTRFKKLMAVNKNFNDTSYGGANNSQSQSAIKKVRS
tara:strand:- start:193 stop:684 length:492 start_codon:yes stop_codon:yes gene_type:complete